MTQTNEEQTINWQNEANKLQSPGELTGLEWYKPSPGQHTIVVTEVGQRYTASFQDGSEVEKQRLTIEVEGKQYTWGIALGKTSNSLWGQLCLYAAANNGLVGKPFTLLVKGAGKQRSYTLLEALQYMKEQEEPAFTKKEQE